jgi:DNA-binding response OmpR family regulator
MSDRGYDVSTAENGLVALDLLRRTSRLPDLVLLDVMMPVMNGIELARELRRDPRLAALPVLIFSAHADHARIAASIDAVAGLAKPLNLDELLAVIGSSLSSASTARGQGGSRPTPI